LRLPQAPQRAERQMQQRRYTVDAAAQAHREPTAKAPALGRQWLAQYPGRQISRQQHAVAGNEGARRSQAPMGGNEIRAHDAIAVEEDAVGPARGEDGAVADLGSAEAPVLVPDMREAATDLALPTFDQRRGRRARAVVGHHNLEIRVGLRGKRTQYRGERVLAVISGDDDGDGFGHQRSQALVRPQH